MKKRFEQKIGFGLALLAIIGLCGFSDISLEDVETAIMQQEYQQAKNLALQLLDKEADGRQSNEIRYYLGLCHLRLEAYSKAQKIFSGLTKKKIEGPLQDRAYLGLFDSYYMSEKYAKADKTIRRLLKVSPKSEFLSLVYLKCARVSLKLTAWEEARSYLDKIAKQFPESPEAHTAKQLLNEKQYFAVQVGAFIERQRAEQLSDELKQKGEYAYIVETIDQQERKFYRVRVGQLALLDEAQKLKSKLSRAGYPTEIYP